MPGQALIAANSPPYWQNQQQRQVKKGPVFIAINCWDWYSTAGYKPTIPAVLSLRFRWNNSTQSQVLLFSKK
jgi:hypothetical protein